MLQVFENYVENTHNYSWIYKVQKSSEYKNKNCDSKVAVQFVQTCLPEIKLFERQLVSLAERKTKKTKQKKKEHLQRNAKHQGWRFYTTKTG